MDYLNPNSSLLLITHQASADPSEESLPSSNGCFTVHALVCMRTWADSSVQQWAGPTAQRHAVKEHREPGIDALHEPFLLVVILERDEEVRGVFL